MQLSPDKQGLRSAIERAKLFLMGRSQDYRQVFNGIPAERVLEDLAKFCRAHDSTFHADPRVAAMLEGRREVFLRIMHHLKLDPDKLWNLYGGGREAPRG